MPHRECICAASAYRVSRRAPRAAQAFNAQATGELRERERERERESTCARVACTHRTPAHTAVLQRKARARLGCFHALLELFGGLFGLGIDFDALARESRCLEQLGRPDTLRVQLQVRLVAVDVQHLQQHQSRNAEDLNHRHHAEHHVERGGERKAHNDHHDKPSEDLHCEQLRTPSRAKPCLIALGRARCAARQAVDMITSG